MNKKAVVTFYQLVQNTHEVTPGMKDSEKKHMQSTVFFALQVDGQQFNGSAVLRQPFGTDYATEPIEVEKPQGEYKGNWNHNQFREAAEDYYRSAIGSQGKMISIGPTAGVIMEDNTFNFSKSYSLEIPD